jgi:hypothetical protein
MANFNFKRFVKRVGNFGWSAIKMVGFIIWALILMSASIARGLVSWVLIWNPISFVIWGCIAPKAMAEALYRWGSWDDTFTSVTWNLWPALRECICAWHVFELPMSAKKHFIAEDPKRFSVAAKVKAYEEFMKDNVKKAHELMNHEACQDLRDYLYSNGSYRDKLDVLQFGKLQSITWEDVKSLLLAGKQVDNYFKNTPSQEGVDMLVDLVETNDTALCLLKRVIYRDGMSPETLKKVMQIKNVEIRQSLVKLGEIRGQIQLVKSLIDKPEEWKLFMQKTDELFKEAEVYMTLGMLKVFYQTKHHLHEENLLEMIKENPFREGDDEYRELIFKNEQMTQTELNYIKSNPKVYMQYIKDYTIY